MLNVTSGELHKALSGRVIAARGEVMQKTHTLPEAEYARDALAKVNIIRLFSSWKRVGSLKTSSHAHVILHQYGSNTVTIQCYFQNWLKNCYQSVVWILVPSDSAFFLVLFMFSRHCVPAFIHLYCVIFCSPTVHAGYLFRACNSKP